MHCLVTGASGFIGSALVPELLRRGYEVTVLLRHSTSPWRLTIPPGSVQVVYGDLQDLEALRVAFERRPVDAVFHLAWFGVTAEDRNSPEQFSTNLVGTLKLWDIAHAAGCKTWIGLGSQAEYGPCSGLVSEDLQARPVTTYGMAKLATGLVTSRMSKLAGIRHVWVRLFSAYGPADDERHMVPGVISTLLQGARPALTQGEQLWDFLYIDDVILALCMSLENPEVSGVFNLGSGEVISIRTIIEMIRDRIDPALPIGFGEVPYRHDQVMHLQADILKIMTVSGWQPRISLAEGLTRTIAWRKNQFNRCMAMNSDCSK